MSMKQRPADGTVSLNTGQHRYLKLTKGGSVRKYSSIHEIKDTYRTAH